MVRINARSVMAAAEFPPPDLPCVGLQMRLLGGMSSSQSTSSSQRGSGTACGYDRFWPEPIRNGVEQTGHRVNIVHLEAVV